MSSDLEEQEDELLALLSIFGAEEFVRNESSPAGEIRVCVELPADFTVSLTEGGTVRQYELSFLPPLLLNFELPADYPSSSPPSFTLTCSWMTRSQLSALGSQLTDLYLATGGAVVLFSWAQFLREDALSFLEVHTHLELNPDERSPQHFSLNSHNQNNRDTSEPGSTDDPGLKDSGVSAPHLEGIPAEGPKPLTSDGSSTDSQGAGASPQSHSASEHEFREEPGPPGESGSTEAEQILQTSENDLSSVDNRTKPLPLADPDHKSEGFSKEGDVPSLPPSGSSGEFHHTERGASALPLHPRESFQNKEQLLPRPSSTPSQTLLSQLLIYDAAQKQREFSTTLFDCGVCFVGWLGSECVQLPECGHIFCQVCLSEICKIQITEGNVRGVTCPEISCTASPTPAQVRSLVGEKLFSRYDLLLLQSTLDLMSDVTYCPRRSCGSPVIVEKPSSAALCSVCRFAFCVTCRKTYHGAEDCQPQSSMKKLTETDQQGSMDVPQSQGTRGCVCVCEAKTLEVM
nr:PREDICTED: E3 ubiquitin-protein ligase RNF14-like [Paralichthys olivaceus]